MNNTVKIRTELTAEMLRSLLDYNPDTGVFTWRPRANGWWEGGVAGSPDGWGHTRIRIYSKSHGAHRLAWLYVYGEWPKDQVDHIDGNPANNAIRNLRDVDNSVNQQNRKRASAASSHGFMGTTKTRYGWVAKIRAEGKYCYLGTFGTPEEASAAYLEAKRRLHVGCTI